MFPKRIGQTTARHTSQFDVRIPSLNDPTPVTGSASNPAPVGRLANNPTHQGENPYAATRSMSEPPQVAGLAPGTEPIEFAPCPRCGFPYANRIKSTFWGGRLGPKLMTHVACRACGNAYNGRTGASNNTNIWLFVLFIVPIEIVVILVAIIAAVFGIGALFF